MCLEKFFVVCSNLTQGLAWVKRKRAADLTFDLSYPNFRDVIIVTDPASFRGMNVTKGIFLPNWEESSKDPVGFLQLLYYANQGKSQVIRKMLEERSE
jgi:hypothetical protein